MPSHFLYHAFTLLRLERSRPRGKTRRTQSSRMRWRREKGQKSGSQKMWVGLRYCFADYKAVCEAPPLKWCVVDLLPLSWREPCKIGFDSPFTDSSPPPPSSFEPLLDHELTGPPSPLVTLRKEGLGKTLIESPLMISLLLLIMNTVIDFVVRHSYLFLQQIDEVAYVDKGRNLAVALGERDVKVRKFRGLA